MPLLPKKRNLELALNRETLKDLIKAHLIAMKVIRYNEEVTDLFIGPLHEELVKLTVMYEPDVQIINH